MIKVVVFDNDGVLSRWAVPQFRLRRIVHQLNKRGVKTAILSNVHFLVAQYFKMSKVYIGFDAVFLSYQERIKKPHHDFYHLVLDEFKCKPHEVLFIENRRKNIRAAKEVGFKTILSRSTDQVVKDLKAVLAKENRIKLK